MPEIPKAWMREAMISFMRSSSKLYFLVFDFYFVIRRKGIATRRL